MSQATSLDTLIPLEAFKRLFVFPPKIDFFPRGSKSMVFGHDQILKSVFFTCLCP